MARGSNVSDEFIDEPSALLDLPCSTLEEFQAFDGKLAANKTFKRQVVNSYFP